MIDTACQTLEALTDAAIVTEDPNEWMAVVERSIPALRRFRAQLETTYGQPAATARKRDPFDRIEAETALMQARALAFALQRIMLDLQFPNPDGQELEAAQVLSVKLHKHLTDSLTPKRAADSSTSVARGARPPSYKNGASQGALLPGAEAVTWGPLVEALRRWEAAWTDTEADTIDEPILRSDELADVFAAYRQERGIAPLLSGLPSL